MRPETPSVIAASTDAAKPAASVWTMAALIGLLFAWPLVYAACVHGPETIIRSLTGDSYHYLAIARKAHLFHLYTYDGVTVTNGFHPLWQYTIRGLFALFDLQSHESQAIAVMALALIASTVGITLAAAAVIRLTKQPALALLLVPGVFYLTAGVHVRTLSAWSALDGMESAFSVLFGGLFFFVYSLYGSDRKTPFDSVAVCKALGLVLPFLILTRLDDVFILPAFMIALLLLDEPLRRRIVAALWIAGPSTVVVLVYMVYNKLSVGAAMPLSGGTKSGFVGFLSAYLTAAIHVPALLDLKTLLTKSPADGTSIFLNSFRFVEVAYPMVAAAFGVVVIRKYQRQAAGAFVILSVCLYIIFKEAYNFLNVHPWHQAGWYYIFIVLCLSVLGALALKKPWVALGTNTIARCGAITLAVALALLAGSQYYAGIVYPNTSDPVIKFWERQAEIRKALKDRGVHGVINVDDGITAFLLDVPNMHGFAFAIDLEGQKAHKAGRMLSLAYSRGIDAIAGFGYMTMDQALQSQDEIKGYLAKSLANDGIRAELDQFEYSVVYLDPVLKMPFIAFKPKAR